MSHTRITEMNEIVSLQEQECL